MAIQDKATSWGKKLDVAGLYRNLAGASQGAYSVANSSGNSAVSNQMQPSQQMLNGTTAAAGLVGQGQQMQLSGLGTIAGLQSQNYNAALANDSSGLGGVMGLAKMGMDIYSGGASSGLWGG